MNAGHIAGLHAVLLELAGQGPDELLTRARFWLADGQPIEACRAAAYAVVAGGLVLTEPAFRVLEGAMSEGSLAAPPVDRPVAYRFDAGDDPAPDRVDTAVIDALAPGGSVVGLWRAWRHPARDTLWPAPKRIHLVLAGTDDEVELARLAAEAQRALIAAGERDPQVEAFADPLTLPDYQRSALADSALLWPPAGGAVRIAPVLVADRAVLPDEEEERLLSYLDEGVPLMIGSGFGVDEIEPELGAVVPMGFRTDGRWIWSDATTYYLAEHGVAPDPGLCAHARSHAYTNYDLDLVTVHRALAVLLENLPPEPDRGDHDIAEPSPASAVDLDGRFVGGPTLGGWSTSEESSPVIADLPGIFIVEAAVTRNGFQVDGRTLPARTLAEVVAARAPMSRDVLLVPTEGPVPPDAVADIAGTIADILDRPVIVPGDQVWFTASGSALATGGFRRFFPASPGNRRVDELGVRLPVPVKPRHDDLESADFVPGAVEPDGVAARAELAGLIGLADVKQHVLEATAVGNLVLCGPPGSGKSTVAALHARLLAASGAIDAGHLVRVAAAELAGDGVARLKEAFEQARGGMLYLDETYRLALAGQGDRLVEALSDLMRDHPGTVVAAAGTPDEMEMFLLTYPELDAGFGSRFAFPAYTADELAAMFAKMAREQGFGYDEEALVAVRDRLGREAGAWNFGNGRRVRQILDEAITRRAARQGGQFAPPVLSAEDVRSAEGAAG